MCSNCNRAKGFGCPVAELGPEVIALYEEIALRIAAPEPLRACDDAEAWDWREFLRRRKALLHQRDAREAIT